MELVEVLGNQPSIDTGIACRSEAPTPCRVAVGSPKKLAATLAVSNTINKGPNPADRHLSRVRYREIIMLSNHNQGVTML